MDNYTYFETKKKNDFDLGYGMVFINTSDKMNEFVDK